MRKRLKLKKQKKNGEENYRQKAHPSVELIKADAQACLEKKTPLKIDIYFSLHIWVRCVISNHPTSDVDKDDMICFFGITFLSSR